MLILLPPSEPKTGRTRGKPSHPERLSFPELASTRADVVAVLAQVSAHADAPTLLGVSVNLLADIAHNTRPGSAPAVPVADLYTGVLYAALDLLSMDSPTRRRANRWLVVVSALFGALRPADKVPPYRLSMGVNLGLGPLASVWRTPLAAVLPIAAGRGVIFDCRSSTYAAAWAPQGDLAARWALDDSAPPPSCCAEPTVCGQSGPSSGGFGATRREGEEWALSRERARGPQSGRGRPPARRRRAGRRR